MLLFDDTPTFALGWDPAARFVELRWKGYAWGDKRRQGMDLALTRLRERRADAVLNDLRLSPILTDGDQYWIATDWRARAIASGLRFLALLQPKELQKQAQQHRVRLASQVSVEHVEIFSELESAKLWLRSRDAAPKR